MQYYIGDDDISLDNILQSLFTNKTRFGQGYLTVIRMNNWKNVISYDLFDLCHGLYIYILIKAYA